MRIAGPDYIHLFKSFPLLPLETEEDAAQAVRVRDWLDTRTQLSRPALQYKAVLEMTILDYDVRKLDEPDLPSAADLGMPPVAAHACTDDEEPAEYWEVPAAPEEDLGDVVSPDAEGEADAQFTESVLATTPAATERRKGRKR